MATDDVQRLVAERTAQYVELWESAASRLVAGTYRSEDYLEDVFRAVGLMTRDATAAATVGASIVMRGVERARDGSADDADRVSEPE